MKKIVIALTAALFVVSCMKDKGNYDYTPAAGYFPEALPEGSIDPIYDVIAGEDFALDPQYDHEVDDSDYDYVWFIDNAGVRDTVGRTLKVDFPVLLKSGLHTLYLKINRRDTNVSRHYSTTLRVVTEFSTGWFVTKETEEGGMTDIDVVNYDNSNHLPDVLKIVNGASMEGLPVKSVYDATFQYAFEGGYEYLDPVGLRSVEPMLTVASTKEIRTVLADEMTNYFDVDKLFMGLPDAIAPNDMGVWIYGGAHFQILVNNGKLHYLYCKNGMSGSRGTDGQFSEDMTPTLDIHPSVCKVWALNQWVAHGVMFFLDKKTNTFMRVRGTSAPTPQSRFTLQSGGALTDQDLVWMQEYNRTFGMGILKGKTDGKYYCFNTVNLVSGNIASPFSGAPKEIPAGAVVSTATVRAAHLTNQTIYCSSGNNEVHAFQTGSVTEQKILTLPAGEQVSFIRHIESSDDKVSFKHLLVLSNNTDGWHMRLYDFKGATWEIASETPVQEYSGKGRAVHALYRQLGMVDAFGVGYMNNF